MNVHCDPAHLDSCCQHTTLHEARQKDQHLLLSKGQSHHLYSNKQCRPCEHSVGAATAVQA